MERCIALLCTWPEAPEATPWGSSSSRACVLQAALRVLHALVPSSSAAAVQLRLQVCFHARICTGTQLHGAVFGACLTRACAVFYPDLRDGKARTYTRAWIRLCEFFISRAENQKAEQIVIRVLSITTKHYDRVICVGLHILQRGRRGSAL